MVKISFIVSLITLSFSLQYAKEKDHIYTFEKAKKFYITGDYTSTITEIRSYLRDHGREKPTEYIVPLLMEALVRIDDYSYFNKLFNIYKRKFPKSDFIPRLFYLDGVVKAREQKYEKAILSFSSAISLGVNEELDSLTVLNIEKICQNSASLEILNLVSKNQNLNPIIAEMVGYYEILALHNSGQHAKSKNFAGEFLKKYPKSQYEPELKKTITKSKY